MSVRALAKRVQQLEQARRVPLSPFQLAFGSIETWEAFVAAEVDASRLDSRDMPVLIVCIRRWHTDRLWGGPRSEQVVYDDE